MRWCCPIFEGLVDEPGRRGLTVIVGSINNMDRFMLQHRAVDAGLHIGYTDVPVMVVGQQVIFHCPGCGARLAKFYAKDLEKLRREDLQLKGEF